MELVKIAEQNKKYFSEDFIKGFDTGAIRQYQHDTAEKHGKWIDKPGPYYRMQAWCSCCGQHSGIGGIESNRHKPYCPNCGAKMDLED